MAKVLAFPVKKELPKEIVDRLNYIAKQYVKLMGDVFEEMTVDVSNEKELNEITELLLMEYIAAVEKAIVEVEEG